MKVYVAGGSGESYVAANYIKMLKVDGIEIVLDWPAYIQQQAGKANRGLSQEVRKKAALADVAAVDAADIFWIIVPDGASSGCWFEFGAAYVLKTRTRARGDGLTIIASGDVEKSLFCELADECFGSHDAAYNRILALAPRCKGCGSLEIVEAQQLAPYAGTGEDPPYSPAHCRKCGAKYTP